MKIKTIPISIFSAGLTDHHITADVLKILKPKHIDILFHGLPVGDLALFEKHFENWMVQNNQKTPPTVPDLTSNFSATTSKPDSGTTKQPVCSVMTMLKETHNGRSILKYYEEKKVLHDEQRHLLIKTIASYVEARGISCSVSDCSEMEKEICSIFPTEELEYYTTGKRGKVYSKIYNLKRLSKICDVKEIPKGENCYEFVAETDATFALQNLRSKNVSADEFDIYWRNCSQYRFQTMEQSKSTEDILKEWPEYLKPSGFKLIEIDFALKFVDAKDLVTKWSFFEHKILYMLRTKITNAFASHQLQELSSCDEESKIFGIFWHLHHLFPPQQKVVMDESGAKIRKKFSVSDSQDSFAIIASSQKELDIKLDLLKLQKTNIQPRLLIIGNITEVKAIFLYFDDIKYPMLKVLTAIDLLFKTFFVFNLQFPKESEIFFNFLQIFFYEMPSKTKFTKIFTIKNEILSSDN